MVGAGTLVVRRMVRCRLKRVMARIRAITPNVAASGMEDAGGDEPNHRPACDGIGYAPGSAAPRDTARPVESGATGRRAWQWRFVRAVRATMRASRSARADHMAKVRQSSAGSAPDANDAGRVGRAGAARGPAGRLGESICALRQWDGAVGTLHPLEPIERCFESLYAMRRQRSAASARVCCNKLSAATTSSRMPLRGTRRVRRGRMRPGGATIPSASSVHGYTAAPLIAERPCSSVSSIRSRCIC